MPNTSASGGFLAPSLSLAPLQDAALLDFIQAWIVGLTGLLPQNIRPRWQPEPPNIPADTVDWAAFGIKKRIKDTYGAELHVPAALGYNEIRRHEELDILVSFYGPNADESCDLFSEGMQVAQNREILTLNNMGLISSGDAIVVPELLKEKWLRRVDLPFSLKRQIVRQYGVQNILTADIELNNEYYLTPITV
jgi:hypothetical protein